LSAGAAHVWRSSNLCSSLSNLSIIECCEFDQLTHLNLRYNVRSAVSCSVCVYVYIEPGAVEDKIVYHHCEF
jgi:hypothetical protein